MDGAIHLSFVQLARFTNEAATSFQLFNQHKKTDKIKSSAQSTLLIHVVVVCHI